MITSKSFDVELTFISLRLSFMFCYLFICVCILSNLLVDEELLSCFCVKKLSHALVNHLRKVCLLSRSYACFLVEMSTHHCQVFCAQFYTLLFFDHADDFYSHSIVNDHCFPETHCLLCFLDTAWSFKNVKASFEMNF